MSFKEKFYNSKRITNNFKERDKHKEKENIKFMIYKK